jgi:copper chaperone
LHADPAAEGEPTMSKQHESVLEVRGMSCPSCIRHISQALCDLDGVARVDVKLRDGLVVVQHDAAATPVDRLIDTLRDAGYESRPRASEQAA